jgi:HD-GYP domain-containing protein (c-di-GMP phosphodiesterase class II)
VRPQRSRGPRERIAKHLDLDQRSLNTIYLSGLLHDIGKIGINDDVLRKPGPLTPAEFEHIKMHPELGYKILVDLNELDEVLPVVLHHHENWDGKGYPRGLSGEQTPLLARIVAVADAFDAMGSDRPYREGMPDDKVDAILRAGAGKQWDAKVIEAFFAVREDIREIARQEREGLALDMHHWM